jgi:hypothetical protein
MAFRNVVVSSSLAALLAATLAACSMSEVSGTKAGPFGGDNDVNDDVAETLNLSTDNASCAKTHLFVLAASSERPGTLRGVPDWRGKGVTTADLEANAARNAAIFDTEIDAAAADLAARLAEAPKCAGGTSTDEVVLLTIVDRDGSGDSKIETRTFSKDGERWVAAAPKAWTFDGTLAAGKGSFELDTSRDVATIVKLFAGLPAAELDGATAVADRAGVAYARISYFIKAHGGRLSVDGTIRPDLAMIRTMSSADLDGHAFRSGLFFDANGAAGGLASSLYVPLWSRPAADGAGPPTAATEQDADPISGDPFQNGNPGAGFPDGPPGSGKSLALSDAVTPWKAASNKEPVEGLIVLGNAATYSEVPGEGLSRFELPVGTDGQPTLVVLDSCYGSPEIAAAFPPAAKVALLYDPNPIFMAYLEYKALSSTDYIRLAPFIVRLAHGAGLSEAEKNLVQDMGSGRAATDKDDDAANGASSESLDNAKWKTLKLWTNAPPED